MAKCSKCGSSQLSNAPMSGADLTHLGIPIKIKDGVFKASCSNCRSEEIVIPNMVGLMAASAIALASLPYKLNGPEIKFLRKALGMQGKELAGKLDVSPETVSRWENGKQAIGDAQEKVLRMLAISKLGADAPGIESSTDAVLWLKIKPVRHPGLSPVLSYAPAPNQSEMFKNALDKGTYKHACIG